MLIQRIMSIMTVKAEKITLQLKLHLQIVISFCYTYLLPPTLNIPVLQHLKIFWDKFTRQFKIKITFIFFFACWNTTMPTEKSNALFIYEGEFLKPEYMDQVLENSWVHIPSWPIPILGYFNWMIDWIHPGMRNTIHVHVTE